MPQRVSGEARAAAEVVAEPLRPSYGLGEWELGGQGGALGRIAAHRDRGLSLERTQQCLGLLGQELLDEPSEVGR